MANPTKRTGTVEPYRDASGKQRYRGRIRLGDGTRKTINVDERYCYSEERAKEYVHAAQEREDKTGQLLADKVKRAAAAAKAGEPSASSEKGESCDKWFDRYHKHQVSLGQTDAVKKRHRWLKWISPRIGHRPMADVTRDEIEDIRDPLDAAILAWEPGKAAKNGTCVSGKTSMNIWSCLTSSFKEATASKRRDLRVRADNPCAGILPPGDRASRKGRRKSFLFPREALSLLAAEAVPLEWREVYAVALYLYLRPGELRVLTWADVSGLEVARITKAWDYADEKVKTPKTANGVRNVPIPDALVPLLDRMKQGRQPSDLVVPRLSSFGEDHLAQLFRSHLTAANVNRAELHASTRTHVQANFRSCRDSGITWLAMTGLGVDKIMRRAGHDMVQTTMGYVKQAEDLTGDLGVPFGPLPASLIEGEATHEAIHATYPKHPTNRNNYTMSVPEEGVEPPT